MHPSHDALQASGHETVGCVAYRLCRLNSVLPWTLRFSPPSSQTWSPRHRHTNSTHSAPPSRNSQSRQQHTTNMNSPTNSTRPTSPPSTSPQMSLPAALTSVAKRPNPRLLLIPPPFHTSHSVRPSDFCRPHCRTCHHRASDARLARQASATRVT